jgi:hypothetical protein
MKKNRKPSNKKLHKNSMTNPHEYEVNTTYSGSLRPFEFYFSKEVVKSKNKIFFLGSFLAKISKILFNICLDE